MVERPVSSAVRPSRAGFVSPEDAETFPALPSPAGPVGEDSATVMAADTPWM